MHPKLNLQMSKKGTILGGYYTPPQTFENQVSHVPRAVHPKTNYSSTINRRTA